MTLGAFLLVWGALCVGFVVGAWWAGSSPRRNADPIRRRDSW